MLTENDIIFIVRTKLIEMDFEILQTLNTLQKGIDLIAKKEQYTLFVEAKGETSASSTTKRYGLPFKQNQIENHISKALLAASKIITDRKDDHEKGIIGVGIALPDNIGHRKVVKQITHVLEKLKIMVFWVKSDNSVEINVNIKSF
ncbi:hypothetical protein GE107_26010 [Cohnella sp. CFH 77786]|uniref:hypothetical protein n=1 Tax=Cohnella sp. CFH 77786 TaxID=2662265 RepID=UPI001C60CC27|nr:hypothetical protein [Cohnella sp. CFH 77786]MBW5449468.1 hypothetical protein [Cohnella sp. CFH 77786]